MKDPKKIQAKLDRYREEREEAEESLRLLTADLRDAEQAIRPLRKKVKALRDLVASRHWQCSLLRADLRRAKREAAEKKARLAAEKRLAECPAVEGGL